MRTKRETKMKKGLLLVFAMLLSLTGTAQKNVYGFTATDTDGKTVKMKVFKGKVLLIVNTATRCGFTPQYKELEALYEQYRGEGLEILDFPCNQFGQQAPGSIAEIKDFCTANYGVQFTQFDKVDVNGDKALPLFTYLKSRQGFGGFDLEDPTGAFLHQRFVQQDPDYAQKSDIKWNFTKFLVDRKGRVVRRFEPTAKTADIEAAVKALL